MQLTNDTFTKSDLRVMHTDVAQYFLSLRDAAGEGICGFTDNKAEAQSSFDGIWEDGLSE